MQFPILINNALPTGLFFSLRDEFEYQGWGCKNFSDENNKERMSWRLNEANDKLVMYQCASIIKLKIQKYLRQPLVFIKAHSNGATFGQTTAFHKDFTEQNVWTFVLFTEQNWNVQWGGEFVCFDPNYHQYRYTTYRPNAGALIPSNWEHYGKAPNETTDKLRTTIAFSYASLDSFNQLKDNPVVKQFSNLHE